MDEFDVRELLKETSYPFLAAHENEWINSEGNILSFDDMSKKYLENCYKYLLEQKEKIKKGFFLQGVKYDKSQYENIVDITNELFERKVSELKKYIG
jgi:hypothetical protein